jgi:hypothetical protein
MRKLPYQLGHDIQSEQRRSRWPLVLLILLLLVGLGPLVLEGAAICVGNWKEFIGASTDVRTPTLDRVQETLQDMSSAFWLEVTPFFRQLPWEPKVVLPAATIIMAMAMILLRR